MIFFGKRSNFYKKILIIHFFKTHKLGGKLKGYLAFSVDYNIRVLFKFIDNSTFLLIDIGSHDVIY